MRKDEWAAAIATGRLRHKRDWPGNVVGLLTVSVGWIAWLFLLFQRNGEIGNRLGLFCLAAGSLPLYAVYCLRQENRLTPIESKAGADANRKLVVAAFQALGWTTYVDTATVVTAGATNKSWIGAGQTATALLDQNMIYLNVIHGSAQKGRLPFYFGSNQRKLKQLLTTIQTLQVSPEHQH
ncbi:hypothetical protein E5K00_01155 [Hymenobacter aquaticus]|uniref:YcxB family protein n=1 Tax=Hymenobacter aquaticus TaxID=1867101 RepID=A0A4Z0Q413_9BACT|nr:hypothetical protein [Hymenobacter aquaticus]TGE23853.1 hypothetical protein E5K00_01155 [Hymenobacter aquaticus]